MIELFLALFTLTVAWFVVKPFFVSAEDFSDLEMYQYEKQDLVRLLESLEFDLARGMINQNDYLKQKEKASERLKNL